MKKKVSELFEGKESSLYKSFMKTIDINLCYKCGKKMKPITEKDGSISRHTFHCDCEKDNLYLSIG